MASIKNAFFVAFLALILTLQASADDVETPYDLATVEKIYKINKEVLSKDETTGSIKKVKIADASTKILITAESKVAIADCNENDLYFLDVKNTYRGLIYCYSKSEFYPEDKEAGKMESLTKINFMAALASCLPEKDDCIQQDKISNEIIEPQDCLSMLKSGDKKERISVAEPVFDKKECNVLLSGYTEFHQFSGKAMLKLSHQENVKILEEAVVAIEGDDVFFSIVTLYDGAPSANTPHTVTSLHLTGLNKLVEGGINVEVEYKPRLAIKLGRSEAEHILGKDQPAKDKISRIHAPSKYVSAAVYGMELEKGPLYAFVDKKLFFNSNYETLFTLPKFFDSNSEFFTAMNNKESENKYRVRILDNIVSHKIKFATAGSKKQDESVAVEAVEKTLSCTDNGEILLSSEAPMGVLNFKKDINKNYVYGVVGGDKDDLPFNDSLIKKVIFKCFIAKKDNVKVVRALLIYKLVTLAPIEITKAMTSNEVTDANIVSHCAIPLFTDDENAANNVQMTIIEQPSLLC